MIKGAVNEAIRVLTDLPYRKKMAEHNFNLGRKLYSIPALRKYLEPLFDK